MGVVWLLVLVVVMRGGVGCSSCVSPVPFLFLGGFRTGFFFLKVR